MSFKVATAQREKAKERAKGGRDSSVFDDELRRERDTGRGTEETGRERPSGEDSPSNT